MARSFFPDVQGIVWFSSYMMYNFIAMALIVLVSSKIISKVTIKNVGMSILIASIIFFIITNFGAWADEKSLYSSDFSGLMASFMAGIPFFRNSLLSNIIFTTVILVALKSIHPLQQDKNQLPGAEINSDKPVDKLTKNKDYYFENGLMVLTAHFLKNRG